MRDPEQFDAFYKEARGRLLAQTFALTGDLGASRRAVRDAFVLAWHRWRKLSRHESPEDVVRPDAWRLALRHHTGRVWHREKHLPDDVRAVLEALGRLSPAQRRTLVLTQLASVSMEQMAREVGLPREQAERELQLGTTALELSLDTDALGVRAAFERLSASVADAGQWPRATIVRRAGAARRRTHTLAGVLGVTAALVVSGSLVSGSGGVRPSLQEPLAAADLTPPPVDPSEPVDEEPEPVPVTLPDTTLLGVDAVQRRYDESRWSLLRTTDNSTGTGMVVPCQQDRYADPRGAATLVRVFGTGGAGGRGPQASTVTQMTEASRTEVAARRAFRTMVTWVAGCTEPRMQLLETRTPEGVGDESVQLVLRSWADPVTTYVVGVARTGVFTTTTALRTPGDGEAAPVPGAALLADAVGGLCAQPDAGACAPDRVRTVLRDPVPVGPRPALVSELDLPPVTGVDVPWVGTDPARPAAAGNAAATGCDRTSFTGEFGGSRFTRTATRTFVVPEADLPQEFGLTETIGALARPAAIGLVDRVREQLAGCADRDLNTEVDEITRRDDGPRSLTAWRLDVRVTDNRSVTFYMAILRVGTSVAQLGFVPAGRATLADGAFLALAERSLSRLSELPAPGS